MFSIIALCDSQTNPGRMLNLRFTDLIVPRDALILNLKEAKHCANTRSECKQFERFPAKITHQTGWLAIHMRDLQATNPASRRAAPDSHQDAEVKKRPYKEKGTNQRGMSNNANGPKCSMTHPVAWKNNNIEQKQRGQSIMNARNRRPTSIKTLVDLTWL